MAARLNRRATSVEVSELPRDTRPLRAKSVNLAQRPLSKYGRSIRSADSNRIRFSEKLFPKQVSVDNDPEFRSNPRRPSIPVRPQNRKVVEKVPFALNVQNLSIPMKYADNPKTRHSISKTVSNHRLDNKTKINPKQVENRRLCETIGGKETQNKLLVQISEAEQVSDFERILNSNAIQSERQGHVWRGCGDNASSAAVRPRSSYSLFTVSQTYHYLFRQHEEALQPFVDEYRQANADDGHPPQNSFINQSWFENLHDLSEYYEDDQDLKKEVETITDRIISEEITQKKPNKNHKYFNVNLADLFDLEVTGEGCSPYHDDLGPSPDVEKENEEWRTSMSANSDNHQNPQDVDCLAQNLDSVKIDSNATVPTITLSNCCDGCARSEQPNNTNVVIHLAVPTIDSDETRPPMI